MIGGMMLLCAVGAMLLIAWWSLQRDEAPDSLARDGLLALREVEGKRPEPAKVSRRHAEHRRQVKSTKARPIRFDPEEMAEIEAEAEATLPEFVRISREEY